MRRMNGRAVTQPVMQHAANIITMMFSLYMEQGLRPAELLQLTFAHGFVILEAGLYGVAEVQHSAGR
jgi:hypothetical protein